MTCKKYKIRKDLSIEFEGHTLYRIEALKNIGDIEKGNIGGFVEDKYNLSRDGECWIYNDAKVFGEASIYNNAMIFDNVVVKNHAIIDHNVTICNNVILDGYVHVIHDVRISGNVQILDTVDVCDTATIKDNVIIKDGAFICGNTKISDNVIISGDAWIGGESDIRGNMKISNMRDVLVIGPIGIKEGYSTFISQKDNIYVQCGNFFGDINSFEHKIIQQYKNVDNYYNMYMDTIEYVKKLFGIS